MRIVFRVDASVEIGAGHVFRCATLAQELASRGADICFVSRLMRGNYIDWLKKKGFKVESLSIRPAGKSDLSDAYESWLGVTLAEEVRDMSDLFESWKPIDWLVTDHYAIDHRWQKILRPFAPNILSIDDLANRSHCCDLLLDQNLYLESEVRYLNLIPAGTKTLLGPRYALLRPEFAFYRKHLKVRDGQIRRLFIFMGGGDTFAVTNTVLIALSKSRYRNVIIDVVVGIQQNPDYIKMIQTKLPNVKFHYRVDCIATLMMEADFAIGASGVATWERAAVGLPALVVSTAKNQHAIASNAQEAGLLTWLGSAENISEREWLEHINETFCSSERLIRQSEACLALVDAMGVQRVVEAML